MNFADFVTNKKWQALVLIIATVIVYYPILGNDFLYCWDDQWMVMNRYTIGGWNWYNIWRIFTEFYNGQYGPFTELSYLIIYTFAGYNPFWFHLASLIWHIGSVLFVWLFFTQLFEIRNAVKNTNTPSFAFWIALILAIHPINVEAVAWISAVKVLIYVFFYVLSLLFYLQYVRSRKKSSYFIVILFSLFSFWGKEQAVTIPFSLLLIDWFLQRNLKNKYVWLEKLPFFMLAIILGIVTILSQEGNNMLAYPFWQRLVYACYAFVEYISKSFIPYNLSYIYPFPSVVGEALPTWLLIYPLLLFVIIYMFWDYIMKWQIMFGLLFFIVHIGITLHVIPLSRFAIVADRYMYLALIGIAFIIIYLVDKFLSSLQGWKKKVTIFLCGCYILVLGIQAHNRCQVWYNTDTVKKELRELLKQRKDYSPF